MCAADQSTPMSSVKSQSAHMPSPKPVNGSIANSQRITAKASAGSLPQ